MKRIITPVLAVLFTSTTLFTSCSSPAEKVETAKENLVDAEENLEKAKQDSVAAHNKAKEEYMARLEEDSKNIAELKLKIAKEKKETRIKNEERIAELEKRNAEMRTSVNNYEVGTLVSWEIFKAKFYEQRDAFNQEIAELGKSLSEAGK